MDINPGKPQDDEQETRPDREAATEHSPGQPREQRPDPFPSQCSGQHAGESADAQPRRIRRVSHRRPAGQPRWSLEIFESPLMDSGIAYTVHDAAPSEPAAAGTGWIEFSRPTRTYRSPSGDRAARVRLVVKDGRLAISAPDLYPRHGLKPTTTPPPDSDGTLRIARLGEDDQMQVDLLMAADGVVTASLRMETIPRAFTRRDIVPLADTLIEAIDLLDAIVRHHRLLIQKPEGPDA